MSWYHYIMIEKHRKIMYAAEKETKNLPVPFFHDNGEILPSFSPQ